MARIGITYEDVAKAVNTVVAEHNNPTVDRVRQVLGTGSKTTIAKYLKDWKAQQGEQHGFDIIGSDNIPTELIGLTKGLWQRTQQVASERIQQAESEAEDRIVSIQKTLSEQEALNQSLHEQLQEARQTLQDKQAAFDTLCQSHQGVLEDKVKLEAQNTALTEQLAQQHDEQQQLHTHLGQMQNNLSHYQDAIQQQREAQALSLDNERHQHEQTMCEMQKRLDEQTDRIHTLKSELQVSQSDNRHIEENLQSTQQKGDILMKHLDDKTMQLEMSHVEREKLRVESESLKKALTMHSTKIHELEKINCELTQNIDHSGSETIKLHNTIQKFDREYKCLLQEKSRLEGQLAILHQTEI